MTAIDKIVDEAANKVKQILLEEARNLKPFPEYCFGIRNKKYATQGCLTKGLLGSKPGILVFDAKKWAENYFVFMLPDGMYEFKADMFEATKNRKPTNLCESAPDWESRKEKPINYLAYGNLASYLMREQTKNNVLVRVVLRK